MSLDIRIPTGLLFLVIGVLLTGFGLMTPDSQIYERSLGININAVWGLVLIAFGALMLGLAIRSARSVKPEAERSDESRPRP